MNILVTGCAGFIGYHTTLKLLREGHSVVGIDNLNDYYSPSLKSARLRRLGISAEMVAPNEPMKGLPGFQFIKADITDKRRFQFMTERPGFHAVCHLAAQAGVRYSMQNPDVYVASNIQGFLNILEYCRACPHTKLIFASSSSVYGNNNSIPFQENQNTDAQASFYAVTKKANELMAQCYSGLYGIRATGLRFFTVYGPWGRPDMAPFLFTDAILKNKKIEVFNRGDMSRDFTYIDDIVEGICKVILTEPKTQLAQQTSFRIYNIGNSKPVNLKEFIETIERIAGKTASKVYLPMQPGDLKDTWADTSLIRQDYDYQPSVSIEKGLTQFIQWYKNFYRTEL